MTRKFIKPEAPKTNLIIEWLHGVLVSCCETADMAADMLNARLEDKTNQFV